MQQGDGIFTLTGSSDEHSPSLFLSRDDEGRVVVSVMNSEEWASITLTDEQVAALRQALAEV
jgi:hypothetical protein